MANQLSPSFPKPQAPLTGPGHSNLILLRKSYKRKQIKQSKSNTPLQVQSGERCELQLQTAGRCRDRYGHLCGSWPGIASPVTAIIPLPRNRRFPSPGSSTVAIVCHHDGRENDNYKTEAAITHPHEVNANNNGRRQL
ncbi:unnamed protein product [Pleuronectes platessa]|uniref:Uncharacterized protein n=1 Tax=Pleuronectes platessa TaxID=8262 RepID=A0A9N7Z4G1_PLEPL|nr:unnamed protein product [Pleuronectes platessa]